MPKILSYLLLLALFGLILVSTNLAPDWLHTLLGVYLIIGLCFLSFGIGYELGLRAKTPIESIFHIPRWLCRDKRNPNRPRSPKVCLYNEDNHVAKDLQSVRRGAQKGTE